MASSAFALTRDTALARLATFLPDAGAAYARLRNHDNGPDGKVHVSRLSAALRRRLISEDEVVATVIARHGVMGAEKFVSEVFWRTYWKGWLEQRPSVWPDYLRASEAARDRTEAASAPASRYRAACEGRTGIDCFDAWTAELAATGYLHNWVRMQFASIWIFTLGLPWELGARFMFDRLIDADPASNTLSWRWVAGLHTAGKAYLADAERITAMTGGRFSPKGLARSAIIPGDSLSVPSPSAPRPPKRFEPGVPSLLLITAEDLSLETLPAITALPVTALAMLPSDNPWDRVALADGLNRARAAFPEAAMLGDLDAAAMASADALGCRQIVTGFAPVGPIADRLAALETRALPLGENLRAFDRRAWPYCRKGFFGLKEKIVTLINAMGENQ